MAVHKGAWLIAQGGEKAGLLSCYLFLQGFRLALSTPSRSDTHSTSPL